MKRYVNLSRLIPAGVMLTIWMLGCQTTTEMTSRVIPDGAARDVTPRLNAATYFAHGHLLERQGRYVRAVQRYERALTLQPNYVSARNRLGITLNKLARNAEASEQFRIAVRTRPELAYLHNNLGFSLYLEANNGPALAALEKAIELAPDFARARLNLALVLARFDRFDEAYAQFQRACNPADAHFNMGIVLSDAGQYVDASSHLQQALALNPDLAGAKTQLDKIAALADQQRRDQQTRLAEQTADQEEEPTRVALDQDPPQVEKPVQTEQPARQTDQMRLAELEAAAALERAAELALQTELERQQRLADAKQAEPDSTVVAGQTEVAEPASTPTRTEKPEAQEPADPPIPNVEDETGIEDAPTAVSIGAAETPITPIPVEEADAADTPVVAPVNPVGDQAVQTIDPTETPITEPEDTGNSAAPAAVEPVHTEAASPQASSPTWVEPAFGVDSPTGDEPDLLLVDPVVPTEVEPIPTTLIPELFIGGSLENILDYAGGRSDSIDTAAPTNRRTAGERVSTTSDDRDATSTRLIANVDIKLEELIELLGLQSEDFEDLLCEFAYYTYPETAPQPTGNHR